MGQQAAQAEKGEKSDKIGRVVERASGEGKPPQKPAPPPPVPQSADLPQLKRKNDKSFKSKLHHSEQKDLVLFFGILSYGTVALIISIRINVIDLGANYANSRKVSFSAIENFKINPQMSL